ncbi:hypothetical protein CMI47_05400 [Candidatus Pacearchaeota archaeon]|jgi:hypothetical protein|nr:hypothetical protein [Candidatus Pacearchaeota archaeon]|tara:strand:+ start:178 stop:459 length:282 start_codon:yes stop_codon:yes gene_type:complete
MTDWQKGDLALYSDASPSDEHYAPPELRKGAVYTVSGVGVDEAGNSGLFLSEQESDGCLGGYLAWRFRKVTPDKADEFDREVIDLMNRKPVGA